MKEKQTTDIKRPFFLLRALSDTRDRQIQKARIQFSNRLSAIERGTDQADGQQKILCEKYVNYFDALEKELNRDISDALKGVPIYAKLIDIKGIGDTLAAKLIAMVDINVCNTISALWRYAGYGVIDGKREKPIKGEKLHYNARLKTTCFLIGTSFLRLRDKSPYSSLYYGRKEFYSKAHTDWTKMHIHRAAMRYMIKQFLADLWVTWRELEGLPIREPYCFEKQGHTTMRDRKNFGW